MADNPLDPEVQLQRKLVLTPCSSKEGLARWFRVYLGLDFPDQRIDDDSTSSPLDVFWEIYDAGVNRRPLVMDDGSESRRVLIYANRFGYKTLGASALELLAMLHMDRNCIHLAAIEQQAGKAIEYIQGFLGKEHLDEFHVGNNKRTISVMWFVHKTTGDILTWGEWKLLDRSSARHQYVKHGHYVKVIVNTPQSSNSDHTAYLAVDELDVVRYPKAYEEAKFIPTTQRDELGRKQPPLTVITSSRKTGGGLVQKEINEAKKTNTLVRHWNALDNTGRCPKTRYRPDEPKVQVWVSDETLDRYTPEQYVDLQTRDPKAASKCAALEMHAGCAECRIGAACKGRLIQQKSKARLLNDVGDTISSFGENSLEMVIAQLLCRRPGNEGAIYPRFSRDTHMLSAAEMWTAITGEPAPSTVDKQMLINLLQSRGSVCMSGMDFGFTHLFAVVTGWIEGRRMFILDAFGVPELEPAQCVDICDTRIKAWAPVLWPDTAYPAYIKMFRSAGYRVRSHKKDVVGGIEAVRSKFMPVGGRDPELFLLRGDEGCEQLAQRILGYKWKNDAAGNPIDIPDETDDDLCDALRYLVQNAFPRAGKVTLPSKEVESRIEAAAAGPATPISTPENWMRNEIAKAAGADVADTAVVLGPTAGAAPGTAPGEKRIKKGCLIFDC